ncbi:MAG: hypothetical protein JF588_03675 [Caulobacterales bacterium]|nr:hypothetical protein [Caulobacterales bacterium]
MRAVFIAIGLFALAASGAHARARALHIAGAPAYAAARRQLIDQGFEPIKVLAQDDGDGGRDRCLDADRICRAFPERVSCAADAPACYFLFRQRADNAYWLVFTRGVPDDYAPPSLRHVRYADARPAKSTDLDGLLLRLPDGRRVSFIKPLPPCSATVVTNCRAAQPGARPSRRR